MLLETIVYGGKSDSIVSNINSIKTNFEKSNISVGMSESIHNNIHFLNVICNDNDYNDNVKDKFYFYFSEILYRLSANNFCEKKLNDILKDNYFFLTSDEIKEINGRCIDLLVNDIEVNDEGIYYINRRNKIVSKIIDCIKENNEININGFMTFRSREIEEEFQGIVDKIVEDYMIEKEYDEFIKLLKYFVDIQESKIEELNIYANKEGQYVLKDSNGENVETKLVEELGGIKSSVNVDDVLISELITLSPEKIIIHSKSNFINKELLQTITSVFENRVIFCSKCEYCNKLNHVLVKG